MRSGDLFFQLGVTLARVLAAFTIVMAAGTAIGLLMGRVKLADRLGDPWLIVLLNLPALVIIVLPFIWGGLTEIAGVLAVAINKLPNTVVTVREGARALDLGLDEIEPSSLFRAENTCGTWSCRSSDPISLQQDVPAFRWSGRSSSSWNCLGGRMA